MSPLAFLDWQELLAKTGEAARGGVGAWKLSEGESGGLHIAGEEISLGVG